MIFTEFLLASAVFTRSIRVLGWQPEAPKTREHDFPKNSCCFFLKFIGPLTPLWVIYPSEIMHLVFADSLLARAVFTRLKRVLGWQPGAPNPGSTTFRKNPGVFLKFFEPATPLWVLYPSEIMHMVFAESLLARAVFTR